MQSKIRTTIIGVIAACGLAAAAIPAVSLAATLRSLPDGAAR